VGGRHDQHDSGQYDMNQEVEKSDFSIKQWEFISLMEAFGEPVSIDVIGVLAPLSPGEFLDFLRKSEKIDWINRGENDFFSLSPKLPPGAQSVLADFNSMEKVSELIKIIEKKNLVEQLPRGAFARLLQRCGRGEKAIKIQMDLVVEALKRNEMETAEKHLDQLQSLLAFSDESLTDEKWFVPKTMELIKLCQPRALGFRVIPAILEKTIIKAEQVGDERTWAMANLMLGRTRWGMNRLKDAALLMAKGMEKVEELGDSDMLTQASSFIGIYYFLRGLQNKAIRYLEKAVAHAENNDEFITSYEAPILLAYCDVDRGEFHRAIGKIDFFRHCALRREDYYIASLYRAVLGIVLWLVRKRKESIFHLEGSQTDALAAQNQVAYWTSLYGHASLYLTEGEIEKGLLFLHKAIEVAQKIGMGHQIFHSIFLESYYIAEKAGGKLPAGWSFTEQFKRIMEEPNIHTKGAALRIHAAMQMASGSNDSRIITDLNASETFLTECDDPVELAKTQIEKARYYLKHQKHGKARELAYEAYQKMSGYSEIYFPDDLRFLLGSAKSKDLSQNEDDDVIEPFVQMMEELIPSPSDLKELDMLMSSLSRFFRAERSGLFTFGEGHGKTFELRSGRNLSHAIVSAETFRESLALIFKSYHDKEPIVIQSSGFAARSRRKQRLSVLCLPLIVREGVIGVLYFDNSYLENCFDFIKTPRLNRLAHHLTNIVEKYMRYGKSGGNMDAPVSIKPGPAVLPDDRFEFISKDRKMTQILNQARKQARSDASVLVLGETGVGKDLLARWIHRHSPRNEKSFVVVDLTTIPENLMESELFGHERGSFTGADRQKIGRVELAHEGTLFVDEIGEISKDLQVKLLRLLQEKSFLRIGGTKTMISDFRLIAASNRNLAEEIKAGRFREDLYYRLNVLEMTIPPLRKRKDDILPLAAHYLSFYTKKYNRPLLRFTPDQESSLLEYHWPGNVRELKNIIERAVIVAENNQLALIFSFQPATSESDPFRDVPTLEEIQRRYIRFVLERTKGRIGGPDGAAKILGMKRTSVNSRLKKLGLK
jgi:transcriptional regulator with GAF, ATPase, and Fis domain